MVPRFAPAKRNRSAKNTQGNAELSILTTELPPTCSICSGSIFMTWATESSGTANVWPDDRTMSARTTESVVGRRSIIVVPRPNSDLNSTVPFNASIADRTMSMPTPRPDTSLSAAAVEKPGRKIKSRAASSVNCSACSGVINPPIRALARMAFASIPRPSSETWTTMAAPSREVRSRIMPADGLPAFESAPRPIRGRDRSRCELDA